MVPEGGPKVVGYRTSEFAEKSDIVLIVHVGCVPLRETLASTAQR